MMTRRDWWLGVVALSLVLLAHAVIPGVLPRYQWDASSADVRFDRWTGEVERLRYRDVPPDRPREWSQ